jgi:hypothetical protein
LFIRLEPDERQRLPQVQQCQRDALGYARLAGDDLLTVHPSKRADLAEAAGITGRRSRFVYVQIAENWEKVQHAASIREALKILKAEGPQAPLDLRDVPLPFDDHCVNDNHLGLPIGQCAEKTWP